MLIVRSVSTKSAFLISTVCEVDCCKVVSLTFCMIAHNNESAYQVSMLSCPALSFVWYDSGFIRAYAPLPFCPKADVVSL